MDWKKTIKYVFFFAVGVAMFWWVYKDLDTDKLIKNLRQVNYFWLIITLLLGILAHFVRAIRWNLLIQPLGYKPRLHNSFFSVLILYLTNLILPRAGEIARCTVLARYEKIPASKLIGTVIIERMVDLVTLLLIAIIIFFINLDVFQKFYETHPNLQNTLSNLLSVKFILILILLGISVIAILMFLNRKSDNKIIVKVQKLKKEFFEGIKSILQLEKKGAFIILTFTIYLFYFLMLYLVFFAYPPTSHLTVKIGLITFLLSGLAMIVPIQGGIGLWHIMVIESLFVYGIDKENGEIFALIAHTSTQLIYLIFGVIAFILLPIFNRTKQ